MRIFISCMLLVVERKFKSQVGNEEPGPVYNGSDRRIIIGFTTEAATRHVSTTEPKYKQSLFLVLFFSQLFLLTSLCMSIFSAVLPPPRLENGNHNLDSSLLLKFHAF
jgi:hypothetical protein